MFIIISSSDRKYIKKYIIHLIIKIISFNKEAENAKRLENIF